MSVNHWVGGLLSAEEEPTTALAGQGVLGEYFADDKLQNKKFERIDSAINFNWLNANPDARLPGDRFSVRWKAG